MKATHIAERYAHFDDGTGWPLPEPDRHHSDSVQWRLRYGQPRKSDLLVAAGVMAAYEALLAKPDRQRREIVSAIRRAVFDREAKR